MQLSSSPWLALQVLCIAAFFLSAAAASDQASGRPLLIAHRGSPCEMPEETLEGYAAAFDADVDFIELDAVSTKDGQLICRHGPTLDDSTDVLQHPDFAKRRRSQLMPDGRNVTGCFTADFTLAEVGALRARQAIPFRGHARDGEFRVPTLDQVLRLVRKRIDGGAPGGAYIETKEPEYHNFRGLPLEGRVVAALVAAGFKDLLGRHVVLQSFEEPSLRMLKRKLRAAGVDDRAMPPLTWLFDCAGEPSVAQLDAFATYGQGLGPDKGLLEDLHTVAACGQAPNAACGAPGTKCSGSLGQAWDGNDRPASALFDLAVARGLYVHPWTVRQEAQFLPLELSSAAAELDYLAGPHGVGVQAVIMDCPATGAAWLRSHDWEGTRPQAQAAPGAIGALTGQPSGGGWLSSSVYSVPDWEAAAAAALVVCLGASAAGFAVWLRRRRNNLTRYDVFPDMVPVANYADFGRRQLSASGMRVPPSPAMRSGDLQLTALSPESPLGLGHTAWNPGGGEHEFLVIRS